jgi:NDP-4-keto-2,6-dideoxyhexose 3-C-methyltransferase
MHYTTRDDCRICRKPLEHVVDFGVLALTSQFPRAGEDAIRAPLHLMQCSECQLLQLEHTVDPGVMYTEGYGYASGVNEQMVAHLTDLVDFAAARYDVKSGDYVFDIACNDGTLLRAWEPYKVLRFGVDPVAAQIPGCAIERRYFEPGLYKNTFKVITSVAVLYDLDDPVTFVQGIADALTSDGVWVAELQYAGEIFDGKWDQICHEHLCYYGLSHVMRLASSAGLYFDYAEVNPSNGGSLRACFTKSPPKRAPRGAGLVNDEVTWSVSRLSAQIGLSAIRIAESVWAYRHTGVFALGASTKGNVILQAAGLSRRDIVAAIDRNPTKVGRRLPGTGIPIVDEAVIPTDPTYLVLPYHFRRSILKRQGPGRYIFPLPNVSVVCA